MAPAKKKQPAAPVVDIDAAEQRFRAEREVDEDKPAPVVLFKGENYQLVSQIPLEVIVALADVDETEIGSGEETASTAKLMVRTVRSLFEDGEWDRFMKAKPTMQNLLQMFDLAFTAYAELSVGESEASEESSSTTGTQPRQPSKRVTASS